MKKQIFIFSSQESYESPVCETINMMVEVNFMSNEHADDDGDDIDFNYIAL